MLGGVGLTSHDHKLWGQLDLSEVSDPIKTHGNEQKTHAT